MACCPAFGPPKIVTSIPPSSSIFSTAGGSPILENAGWLVHFCDPGLQSRRRGKHRVGTFVNRNPISGPCTLTYPTRKRPSWPSSWFSSSVEPSTRSAIAFGPWEHPRQAQARAAARALAAAEDVCAPERCRGPKTAARLGRDSANAEGCTKPDCRVRRCAFPHARGWDTSLTPNLRGASAHFCG
jgi:hypothetical protein